MAVDRAFIAHVDADLRRHERADRRQARHDAPWQHLLIAQDTGAGILGAVRGDIYWGDDADAEELGGRMGGPGPLLGAVAQGRDEVS